MELVSPVVRQMGVEHRAGKGLVRGLDPVWAGDGDTKGAGQAVVGKTMGTVLPGRRSPNRGTLVPPARAGYQPSTSQSRSPWRRLGS